MNIYSNLGFENGTKIMNYVESILTDFGFDPKCTFEDMYCITGKELKIVAANISRQEQHIFSHQTTPKETIIKAVRASIAIPFIFTPVQKDECSEEILVDGAILNNCPIDVFDGPNGEINKNAIGFTFVSSCLLYTSPSPRDRTSPCMASSA